MVAPDAGQIEHLRPPGVGFGCRRPPDHVAPPPFAHQGEHDVPGAIEVVRRDHQLAKAWLAEILGQQLRVAPRQIGGRRLPDLCRPRTRSQSTRQQCAIAGSAESGAGTRRHQNGPRWCRRSARRRADQTAATAAPPEHEQRQPRQPGRQRGRRERRLGEPHVGAGQPAAGRGRASSRRSRSGRRSRPPPSRPAAPPPAPTATATAQASTRSVGCQG